MKDKAISTEKGHWILAKMGKKVLRPGGKELTLKLIDNLEISHQDKVVEFAPGMGFTAELLVDKKPKTYTGIEINEEAAHKLQGQIKGKDIHVINTSAAKTGLENASADKVIAEAMLTMQADHRKSEIIAEAYRILKNGGLYGIHELGLVPNEIDPKIKEDIQRKLAMSTKVNARPLTQNEWCRLLEKEGFKIKQVFSAPMHLLEPKRMISDEGFFNAIKIGFNMLTHPRAKKTILQMRAIFKEYEHQMTAFAIIAEKNSIKIE